MVRLGKKNFHGDRGPDRADLMMFSTIERKLQYRAIKNVIYSNRDGDKFMHWYDRMKSVLNVSVFSLQY